MRRKEFRLAENLKTILSARKLTLNIAAKKTGMNKSTLHGYYNGVLPRNLIKISQLADYLEIPLNELLFGKEHTELPEVDQIEGRYELTIKRISKSIKLEKR